MSKQRRSRDQLRIATLVAGLAFPTLTLIPFGSIWLWQNGYLLFWAIAGMVCVASAVFLQRRFFPEPAASQPKASLDGDQNSGDPTWTPAEQEAWHDVLAITAAVDAEKLTSRDAVLELGVDTIRAVARRLHPEVSDPVWQFTLPEAFALTERVSRRLRRFTVENVPLGDRLTIANAMTAYRWRGAFDVAEKAYDIWRMARLVNPVTAATHELRERLSKQLLEAGRTHVTDRLVDAYVSEVGRAAIDLYGGRLRITPEELEQSVTGSSILDAAAIARRSNEPLRILICGQTGSGKSSLVNALAGEVHAIVDALPLDGGFTPYRIAREGFPGTLVVDSPGLDGKPETLAALVEQAKNCDLLIPVVPANRADRQIERQMLDQVRSAFAAMPRRRPPPVVAAMTQIDRLRPFQEWAPPYDLAKAQQPKAASIKAAMEAVASDLSLSPDEIVPVSLRAGAEYNIDALWGCIAVNLPEAQRAKLVRQVADRKSGWMLRKVWSQAVGAGRVIGRSLQR